MRLSDLPKGTEAIIVGVESSRDGDLIALRLRDLGFVADEPVRVVARNPLGGDPLVVQIGFTRFALRRAEAARVILASA
jgi:ferrous iron transport protein A